MLRDPTALPPRIDLADAQWYYVDTVTINNGNQLPTQIVNPRGYTNNFVYDSTNSDPTAQKNLLSTTTALGKVWAYSYDSNYNLTNSIDPLGHQKNYTYDSSRRATSFKNGLAQLITTNTYTAYGQLASIKNGASNTTSYYYNANGYRTNTVDAAGKGWGATYDPDGNKLTATNPLGKTTSYAYDKFYKVASITNALGQVTLFTRDDMANLISVQDGNSNTISRSYDLLQRITSITNSLGNVTKFSYNVEGGTTQITDANTNSYNYTFDGLNRTKTFVYPDSSQESYLYDADSNLITVTNRASQVISGTYDAGDRRVTKTWQGTGGRTFDYTYDDADRLTGITKFNGTNSESSISYIYNAANQIITNTTEGYGIAYQYDNAQRVSQLAYPSGAKANYTYDSRSKLSAITDESGSSVASYTYNDAGRVTKKTLSNGLESVYEYDDANRITKVALRQTSNPTTIIQSFVYGYDNVGNRLYVKYASGSGDVYQYDSTYQLTGVKYGVSNPTAGYASASGATRIVTYVYDAVGNRTSIIDGANTTTYTVNNLNQYTAAGGVNYTYSGRGDLTGDGTWTYSYDHEGHLIAANKTGTTVSYLYDAIGRRIQKNVNGTVTNYVYSDKKLIEERNGGGTVIAKYIYQKGIDKPVRVVKGSNTYYFAQDALGNVTSLTDSSGNIVESYTYDIYGAPTIKNNSGTVLTSSQTPFLFTGREYDSETGFYHYRARAYSPLLGRFLQPDPAGFGARDVNLYRYVGNNVVNLTDPSGLCDDNDQALADNDVPPPDVPQDPEAPEKKDNDDWWEKIYEGLKTAADIAKEWLGEATGAGEGSAGRAAAAGAAEAGGEVIDEAVDVSNSDLPQAINNINERNKLIDSINNGDGQYQPNYVAPTHVPD